MVSQSQVGPLGVSSDMLVSALIAEFSGTFIFKVALKMERIDIVVVI